MSTTLAPTASPAPARKTESAPQHPHETIWSLTNACVPSASLHLVAELGVADHIGEEAVPVDALGARCGVDPGALDRVLSLLASHGVFARQEAGWAHTAESRLLRSDNALSMRAFPRLMGLPLISATLANLEHSVRTGAPAVEAVDPRGFWAYLEDHPDEARIFGQAMEAKANADIAAILQAYDFGRFGTVADIGGGRGHLLRAVLDAAPGARGVLFDLPKVVAALEVQHERLSPHAGDFFVDALPAADAYVLMEVLHDWPDDECVAILGAVRTAAHPGALVLVIENVLADGEADPRGRCLDVIMLAVTGGRERTAAELRRLFRRAGLRPGGVVETAGPLRIVEATVA